MQKVCSWTVRDVRCPGTSVHRRCRKNLDSANPRDIKKAVSVAAKMREDTASMTSEHKFLGGNRGNLCVK